MPIINKLPSAITGLGTYTYTLTAAGPHRVLVRATVHPVSGLQIVIKQNATTIVTSPTIAAHQNHVDVTGMINGAVSDVISIIMTSSSATDSEPNHVKAVVVISQGQGE